MKKIILAIAFLFLTLSFFSPAKSLAMTADIGAPDLAKEAKMIVRGEVKSVRSHKGINDIIYTRASVLVNEVIKGKIAKKNIIVEYKENDTDVANSFNVLATENAPSLKQGEEVILFLTSSFWRKNVYYLVGGSSGKYAVCADNTIKTGSSCDE